MKLSCKVSTLVFLVLGCNLSVHAQQQEDPNLHLSPDATPSHALASASNIVETREHILGAYEEAMKLLTSLPKYQETSKKFRSTSRGIFQTQLQKISNYLYQSLFSSEKPAQSLQEKPMSATLQKATHLLESEAERGNPDALFNLAELNFFSYYGHPRNLNAAFNYYSRLASEKGNATAQRMVAFMYATGVGNVVERDLGKALLYTTFAALGQDTVSQMMLGFRHYMGIGTPESCEDALWYYKKVADKAMEHYKSGPPGGRALPLPKIRLADEHGGIYGYVQSGSKYHDQSEVEDILQYHRQLAENGAISSQHLLGEIYYYGSHSIQKNHEEALKYFQSAASHMYANKRVKVIRDQKNAIIAANACGMLGEMYRRGEAVPQDYNTAHLWYSIGAKQNDHVSLNGLGVMYQEGIVVEKNLEKAVEYLQRAAEHKHPEAQVHLGLLYLNAPKPGYELAFHHLSLAYKEKYFPASYYLAEMYYSGQGIPQSCAKAVALYKSIAERGDWLYSPFPEAYRAYQQGDIETALLWYLIAAEMGYEIGQTNAAWLLDQDRYELLEKSPNLVLKDSPLVYWTRSANQDYRDSRVKMGDYYFYGIGTEVDLEQAANCYYVASGDSSALGLWNMGWMYENGVGVAKDYHLAKRAYDSSLVADPDAYLPVTLSLIKLNMKFIWSYITGETEARGQPYPESVLPQDADGDPSLLNPLRDSSNKQFEKLDQEEELNQWEKEQRDEGNEYDRDNEYHESESSYIEDMIILALCLLVGWMVYVRQFRADGGNPNVQPWGPPPINAPRR